MLVLVPKGCAEELTNELLLEAAGKVPTFEEAGAPKGLEENRVCGPGVLANSLLVVELPVLNAFDCIGC